MRSHPNNLEVLFEDNHLIVINKRSGDIIQGDKTGDRPLSEIVKEYLAVKYDKPGKVFLGVTHRIDRPTSGVIVFARTSKALERMNKLFREKQVDKTYWALVEGKPKIDHQRLEHYLKKNPKNNKSSVHTKPANESKQAVLTYQLLKKLDNYSLLEVELETGRHHQIRAQLAFIGHPIKGDLKYGARRSNKDGSIHLHARAIRFIHPVRKEEISIHAPLPEDPLWNACL